MGRCPGGAAKRGRRWRDAGGAGAVAPGPRDEGPRAEVAERRKREALERQGGSTATVGALLCLSAVMHGAVGQRG